MRLGNFRIFLTTMVILVSWTGPLWAISAAEVRNLLDRYDKDRLIRAVLQIKDNRITVFVKGRYMEFTGPPSPNFINVDTLLLDLKQTGVDAKQLKGILERLPREPRTTKTLTLKGEAPTSNTRYKPPSVERVRPPANQPLDTAHPRAHREAEPAAPPEPSLDTDLTSPALGEAATNCEILAFSDFMSPSARERVQRFEIIRANIQKALDELYATSFSLFGDRIQRSENTIRFEIDGRDPRWVDVLGPQWKAQQKATSEEPSYFPVEVAFNWAEECRLLLNLVECLENAISCREQTLEDSALRMEKDSGSWRIVDTKSAEEWQQAFRFGEGMTEILQWARGFIADTSKPSVPYEEVMLSMAFGYIQRVHGLLEEVTDAGER